MATEMFCMTVMRYNYYSFWPWPSLSHISSLQHSKIAGYLNHSVSLTFWKRNTNHHVKKSTSIQKLQFECKKIMSFDPEAVMHTVGIHTDLPQFCYDVILQSRHKTLLVWLHGLISKLTTSFTLSNIVFSCRNCILSVAQ